MSLAGVWRSGPPVPSCKSRSPRTSPAFYQLVLPSTATTNPYPGASLNPTVLGIGKIASNVKPSSHQLCSPTRFPTPSSRNFNSARNLQQQLQFREPEPGPAANRHGQPSGPSRKTRAITSLFPRFALALSIFALPRNGSAATTATTARSATSITTVQGLPATNWWHKQPPPLSEVCFSVVTFASLIL